MSPRKKTPVAGEEQPISPTPKPLKDNHARYNDEMREKAAALYRRMKAGEQVHIAGGVPEVVGWMRRHGVAVKAHMDANGTYYSLVPSEVAAGEALTGGET